MLPRARDPFFHELVGAVFDALRACDATVDVHAADGEFGLLTQKKTRSR